MAEMLTLRQQCCGHWTGTCQATHLGGALLFICVWLSGVTRDKKGWTQRVGLANVSPKGLYHGIRGWFKLENGS